MSAIAKDAADIPTDLPHPTGAATVINSSSVASPSTTTANPTASGSASAPSASSASSPASACPSHLAPRDFPLEDHEAEYRAHAFLANETIVATKLAADKFLQNLFTRQSEPDKDILRAASAASRTRLQNPFAFNKANASGSSGSSGASGSSASSPNSSGSSSSSGSPSSSYARGPSSSSGPSSPAAPATPAAVRPPVAANPHAATRPDAMSIATPALAPALTPAESNPETNTEIKLAEVEAPLTEADFTDCIKLDDVISNTATAAAPASMSELIATAAAVQPNPGKIVATPTPEAASDLAIWPFNPLTISPPALLSSPATAQHAFAGCKENFKNIPRTKWAAGP